MKRVTIITWGFMAGKSTFSRWLILRFHGWEENNLLLPNSICWEPIENRECTHTCINETNANRHRPEREREREREEKRTLMFCESVNNIVSRSIPNPQPPVGGNPYSRAVQKVSSKAIASSSPDCRSCMQTTYHSEKFQRNLFKDKSIAHLKTDAWTLSCSANCWRCTTESFNSVYALQSWAVTEKLSQNHEL